MYEYKYLFKILVVGDSGVGKSCLLRRFADGRFSGQHQSTVGIDFKVCTVELGGNVVKLQIWDTAGEERFHSLLPAYYRGAHGILLVYDTTSLISLRNLDSWLQEIGRFCPEHVCVLMVGNKCDEVDDRQVGQEQAMAFAVKRGLDFREVSAKSGVNVEDVFLSLALDIYETLVLSPPATRRLKGGWDARINMDDAEQSLGGPENWRRLREGRENSSTIRLAAGEDRSGDHIDSCC